MPVADFLNASGVRVRGGEQGRLYRNVGEILAREGAIDKGIDQNLWAILKIVADQCGVAFHLYSVDTGQHARLSRHYEGRAVDINKVGRANSVWTSATIGNRFARQIVDCLLANGFRVGERKGRPGLIWGPARSKWNPTDIDHSTHIHISLAKRRVSSMSP